MNKTALKNFATGVRWQLIEAVKQRLYEISNSDGPEPVRFRQLMAEIDRRGNPAVIEGAADLWFCRFIGLRYMEVNGLLPSDVRVFTDAAGKFNPEILERALTVPLEGVGSHVVRKLPEGQAREVLYRDLLIAQCNGLSRCLPCLFEEKFGWAEPLLPANLLGSDSVIAKLISQIPSETFQGEVEMVGWLYQFYLSEKHDRVVDPLRGKGISKEDIPAATQLFTPRWVVRYILDNSLGRYWLERHPESKLTERLTYLAKPKDGPLETIDQPIPPEKLKVLDPCVGAGHFLSYAFDLLLEIYREQGWTDKAAVKSILENNLYGVDIDDRAVRLACFAMFMKARTYDPGILKEEIALNIVAMEDSDGMTDDFIRFFAKGNPAIEKDLHQLRTAFHNAKEYGSMIHVPRFDAPVLHERIDRFFHENVPAEYRNMAIQLQILVRQGEILSKKYDIVATNPPYMNKYSPCMKEFLTQHYSDYKGDLFSVFMIRSFDFCKENGYSGFMTPMVWMFIQTYEKLRRFIMSQKSLTTLIQFAYSAFEEATVPICAFVLQNGRRNGKALCFRLSSFNGGMELQNQKVIEALKNKDCGYFYEADQSNFSKIPGCAVAYWLSDAFIATFEHQTVGDVAKPRQGLATGCNDLFIRQWYEVSGSQVCYDARSVAHAKQTGRKWFPYNKGGEFRKWYGNNDYLVNWENDGQQIRNFKNEEGKLRSRPQNTQFYFRESISWSLVSSGTVAFRYKPYGQIFDIAGMSCFAERNLLYLLGLCNSPVAMEALAVLAPTINFQAGDIANIPVVVDETQIENVEALVKTNVELAKEDWDSFETSWDFKKHPLI